MRFLQTEKNRGVDVGERMSGGMAPSELFRSSIGSRNGSRLSIQPFQIAQQHYTGNHKRSGISNWRGPCDAANSLGAVENGHQRYIQTSFTEQGEENRRKLFAGCLKDGDDKNIEL